MNTMHDFPVLESERLLLTRLYSGDITGIVRYAGNPKIARMTLNIPHPYTRQDAVNWIRMAQQGFQDQSHFIFGIRLKESNEFIGGASLDVHRRFDRAELGYWIAEPFWHKGFATESVERLLAFGFKVLKLNKIFACHFATNPGSGKVMIKNKMIKEAELTGHVKKDGEYLDVIQYRLTRDEYNSGLSNTSSPFPSRAG